MTDQPRLMSGADVAAYLRITPATFSKWVAAGRAPAPLPGTRRWDKKAIDLALDKASDIQAPSIVPDEDPYEAWKRQNAAEQ
jgi:hypothetical protein